MPVACPYCKAVLNPKGIKPGQFKPKCPGCGEAFVLLVAEDQLLTAKPLPKPATAQPTPATVHAAAKAADPHVTGDFTEPAAADANRTGDFADAGNATADFSHPPPGRGEKTDASDDTTDVKTKKKSAKREDAIPEKLGGYEVVRILGKGGMGAVLLGRQVSLDRKVALKIMHARLAKDPGFVARFTREAYAAAQLTHHNVVQIYDIGEDRGTHFFSMEFVNGKSLMEVVRKEGKLDAEVAVGYVLQAARGLRYGHDQGMVHRDIKPDNLMLNSDGIVKVADLGLVKLPTPEAATTTPATATRNGSPAPAA